MRGAEKLDLAFERAVVPVLSTPTAMGVRSTHPGAMPRRVRVNPVEAGARQASGSATQPQSRRT